MAILVDFTAPTPTRAQAPTRVPFGNLPSAPAAGDRPKAQLYLRTGYTVTGDDRFVNLPFGLPIDTMNELDVKGQKPEWIALRQGQNAYLRQMIALGLKLAPGEDRLIMSQPMGNITMQVRLYRVKAENEAVASVENELTIDLDELLTLQQNG